VLIPLFHRNFGEYLTTQRRAVGWSQEELAERSTVSVRTIRNLETGAIKSPRKSSVDLLLGAVGPDVVSERARMTSPGWAAAGPRPASGPAAGPTAVPAPADSRWWGTGVDPEPIVGRTPDLEYIRNSLHEERRIVLTGPGGVGKTRLALAAANQMRTGYRDGVVVVEAGGLPGEGADPRQDLKRLRRVVLAAVSPLSQSEAGWLPDNSQMLVIIDNVEHVTTATTLLAQQILDACSGLHLIITSRRPLCTPSAPVWDVSPLAFDDSDEQPDAVELFLRRAKLACPDLDLSDRLDAVRDLCAKLDGIPFAIELAALRLRSVSLDTLLRDGSITQMLGQVRSADLPHHRTLADSVRWSYEMLTQRQRTLLDHLATFTETFTIEDVEQLYHCVDGPVPAAFGPVPDALSQLAELVDSSLVQVERGPRYSYRLLGYVREFVLARREAIPVQRTTHCVARNGSTDGQLWEPLPGALDTRAAFLGS
jgi:predicted ATPase